MSDKKFARDRAGLVRNAMRQLRRAGFTADDTAKMLGYDGNVGSNLGYLEKVLVDLRAGKDVEDRSEVAVAISDRLDVIFENDQEKIKKWIAIPLGNFNNKSLKEMMLMGSLNDLRNALLKLRQIDLSKV